MNTYQNLCHSSKKQALLASIEALLCWDIETYLPPRGLDARSEQVAQLATLLHEELLSPEFLKNLQKLVNLKSGEFLKKDLTKEEMANVREWRRSYVQASSLPSSFVKEFAETTSLATITWQKAREENRFSLFLPMLKKIISLCRKKADYLGYESHPYDALLDLYEPKMTIQKITPIFKDLKEGLASLLQTIKGKKIPPDHFLTQEFPAAEQMQWTPVLLSAYALNPDSLRVDLSAHPFSTGIHPTDVRITSHIDPHNLTSHLFSILHEAGHALYDQNLPVEHYGTPLCEAVSMGMHESQSRFWEVFIGKSRPFWLYFYPQLQKSFPRQLKNVSFDAFYQAIHIVKPSLIRIASDEVTYSLHIIIRFEIEKALIEGSAKPEDIPDLWNEKMQSYLGITPPSDKEGCLQDIHWSQGSFGYFPSYSLGNLYAAQFFHAFKKDCPDWENSLQKGEFAFISSFLKEKIHRHGKLYSSEELLERVTKKPLDASYYLNYLKNKYEKL
jgi:carboxypeptidase Taq